METDSLSIYNQIIAELLGDQMTGVILITSYIFTFCGLFVRWYIRWLTIGKPNPKTPTKFILSYWLRDNLLPKLFGILATVITIFLTLRFANELFGATLSYAYAVMIGLGWDVVSDKLKKLQKSV